jgi:uncharacterized protein
VLVALIDPKHVHHDVAHKWFSAVGRRSWATCPLTENAVLRIVGSGSYFNSPGAPAIVAASLESLMEQGDHVFWADDISLLDAKKVDRARLLTARQVTDSYLLALACAHGGKFATFDRRVATSAVVGGSEALHHI